MEEPNKYSKACYRCDAPVRMSGPEFTRNPNLWTVCAVCSDKLKIEFNFACPPAGGAA